MKIFKLITFFYLIYCLSLNSYSQGTYNFNVIGALPVSDYGSDDFDDEDSGGAGLGVGLGIQYVHPLMNNGLGVFAGVDIICNGYKKSFKQDFEDLFDVSVDIKYSKMFNVPLSFGLNYSKATDSGLGIFANLGLTYNFFKETNQIVETDYGDITMSAKMTSAFGFKVGGGLKLNDKVSVFINYLGLGTHDQKYILEASGLPSEDGHLKIKIDIVTIGIGFAL